jgi:hypothetical protein
MTTTVPAPKRPILDENLYFIWQRHGIVPYTCDEERYVGAGKY